jgi:hypothetical protein
MKRATRDAIESFAQSYILNDDIGRFIPLSETSRMMSNLMKEFSGIFCGVEPEQKLGTLIYRSLSKHKETLPKGQGEVTIPVAT